MPSPGCVFKIVASKPDLTTFKMPLTELDEQSGFIHLSTGPQVPHTCDRFFSLLETLYIIKFPYNKLEPNMKWEPAPGGEELFPHLYEDLFSADVDSIREFHRDRGSWQEVLGKAMVI